MNIEFENKDLQELCQQQKLAIKKFGSDSARKLKTRLADLLAAKNVSELVAGRPHPLKGNKNGQLAIDLAGGIRLVFESANIPIPYKQDGSIDWLSVDKIKIVLIGDYHD